MYTTRWCGFCRRLKSQLARDGIEVREIDIEVDPDAAGFVMSVNGGNQTAPTVVLADGSAPPNPPAAAAAAAGGAGPLAPAAPGARQVAAPHAGQRVAPSGPRPARAAPRRGLSVPAARVPRMT